MKVLLTGGSGQVGQEIIKCKPQGIEIINPCRKKLDLSHLEPIYGSSIFLLFIITSPLLFTRTKSPGRATTLLM